MGKPVRKLSVKKETLRQLDSLTGEQLRQVAGGGYILLKTGYCIAETLQCAGVLTGGGGTLVSCFTCEPDTSYCLP